MSTSSDILITDTLFIHRKHEQMLEEKGFHIVRLPLAKATEVELCQAIKGKVGYILGGIETITKPVIDAADQLRAIVFTGIDFHPYIPAAQYALDRRIVIGNTPDGPTQAVAEWAMGAALLMSRHLFEGQSSMKSAMGIPSGLEGQRIGIIGYGNVGRRLASMLSVFKPTAIACYSRHPVAVPVDALVQAVTLEELLAESDVIFLCISEMGNIGWLNAEKLNLMKKLALLVSITHRGVIDEDALYEVVRSSKIRAAVDQVVEPRFASLPASHWFCTNQSIAFCTPSEIDLVSTMAVEKMVELLCNQT